MLLIGLGNPSEEYQNTRHNTGQIFLNYLVRKEGLRWEKRKKQLVAIAQKGKLTLAKPLVFMNESGQAVSKISVRLSVPTSALYIVHDELDLKLGDFKITFGKSSPLHKGVASVEKYLKTKDFWRIRIGIDNRKLDKRISGEEYVLQNFSEEEKEILKFVFNQILVLTKF